MAIMLSPSTTDSGYTPSLIAATSSLAANSTSRVTASAASQPSSKPSKTTIALLAAIGSVVVSVFVGCFIYSRYKSYRARRTRHPSKPSASLSLNLSTGRGTQTTSGPSTREVNTTFSNEARRAGQSHDVPREPEERWSPRSHPEQQASQRTIKDEEPQYKFSHPYQVATQDSISSLPTDPTKQTLFDMRSLALSLPVSSHAPVIQGSSPSRLAFVGPAARASQSSSGHARSDSGGRSDEAMIPSSRPSSSGRPSLKISTNPPVQNQASKLPEKINPPERRFSKSFLVFDDGDSPTSSSQAVLKQPPPPPPLLPVTPEHVSNEESDSGEGMAPSSAKMMTVIASYTPRLQDELPLTVGDVVKLVQDFDDGWCVVEQVGTADVQSGAVPKVCLHQQAST